MLPSAKSLNLFKADVKRKKNVDEGYEEEKQDLKLHCKKLRTFPSVPNQFVIHIFYPLDNCQMMQEIYQEFSQHSSVVIFEDEPHISFIYGHYAVQYHQIQPLLEQLIKLIQSFKTFSLCFGCVRILTNNDKSRNFIALCENEIYTETTSTLESHRYLIKSIHQSLKQYRSEIYYPGQEKLEKFMFHTSIAWFLSKNQAEGQNIYDQVNKYLEDQVILVKIDKIQIKIGHFSRTVHLL